MFKIENISKSYGKKNILSDISLEAKEGEAIGILGINGSGKSTLLNEIARKYVDSSEICLGFLPQENPLFDELKPIDNIKMWCDLKKSEIIDALGKSPLSEMDILSFLDTPVGKMSGGMKKRVSLASVLIRKPDVLLLDEPFAALDLTAKHDILQYINNFRAKGGITIIASHEEEIFNICSKVYLLKQSSLYDTDELKSKGIKYIDMLREYNE